MERQDHASVVHTTPELGRLGNPLVIKGVERIEAIVLPGEDVRRQAEMYTHAIGRIMRRDYNLTSVKLFWHVRGFHARIKTQSLVHDLVADADRLEDLARPYELPGFDPVATCIVRIVSDEASLLFDALITADRALFKLLSSPVVDDADKTMTHFVRALTALRKEVFGSFAGRRQLAVQCESRVEESNALPGT